MKFAPILAILFLSQCLYSQGRYEKKWEKVEELELENKIEDAQKIVQRIDRKAKRRGDDDQLIKAFLYKSKFDLMNSEGAFSEIEKELQKLISTSSSPSRNIYQMIYAKMLNKYRDQKRYNLRQREKFDIKIDSLDHLTWDLEFLDGKIRKLYLSSVENHKTLGTVSINKYAAVVSDTTYSKKWKPTILDLLSRETLAYLTNDRYYFRRINIDSSLLINALQIDLKLRPSNFDSYEGQKLQEILKIYSNLEEEHKSSGNIPAYLKAVTERLAFVNGIIDQEPFQRKYTSTLQNLIEEYKFFPSQTIATYQLAIHYFKKAQTQNPIEDSDDYKAASQRIINREKAIELASHAIEDFPKSFGARQCKALLEELDKSLIDIRYEGDLYPGQPSFASMQYKNIDSLKVLWKKISLKNEISMDDSLSDAIYKKALKENSFEKSQTIVLGHKAAGFRHKQSILWQTPKQEGYYIIYFLYSYKNITIIDYETLCNTSLYPMATYDPEQAYFKVLDKKSGYPLEGVGILGQEDDEKPVLKIKTDETGKAQAKVKDFSDDFTLLLTKDQDSIVLDNYYLDPNFSDREDEPSEKSVKTYVYLDRGIYRPGQEVFYKVIAVIEENGKTKVLANEKFKFYVDSANSRKIFNVYQTTNEYGSFHGSFTIPENIGLGTFDIEVESDEETPFWDNVELTNEYETAKTFKVEEYKRPRFEVEITGNDQVFLMGSTVDLTVNAEAFFGAAIDGARVNYSIYRKITRSGYNSYSYGYDLILSKTYKNDSITTDTNGKFYIDFLVEPSVNAENEAETPLNYTYRVEVEVIDINGEIHEAETVVQTSATENQLVLNVPEEINKDNRTISFYTENLEREKIESSYLIKIFRSQRNPYSERYDDTGMSEKEMDSIFKDDINYKVNMSKPKDSLVYRTQVHNKIVSTIDIPLTKAWQNGYYKIEVEKIRASDQDDAIKENRLIPFWIDKNSPLEPVLISHKYRFTDDGIDIDFYTSADSTYVNMYVFEEDKDLREETFTIYKGKTTYKTTYSEPLGSVTKFKYETLKHGVRGSGLISIERAVKEKAEISIKTASFRNKLKPGTEEKWSFQLENENGNPFEIEALASMYDSSLDAFENNVWQNIGVFNDRFYPKHEPFKYYENLNNSYGYRFNGVIDRGKGLFFHSKGPSWNFHGLLKVNYENLYRAYLKRLSLKKKKAITGRGSFSGLVIDLDGSPVLGATVHIMGTKSFTTTDFDGNFRIDAKKGDTIQISYTGYDSIQHVIGTETYKKIEMSSSNEPIMVHAYSVAKAPTPNSTALQRLLGQIPGVKVQTANGQPGANSLIQLRGVSSINGNTEPLFIIDDIPVSEPDFSMISTEMIDSLKVLKPNEAVLIYGNIGKNGVIIIELKQGFTYQDLMAIEKLSKVETRKNLDETAFFLPELYTDEKGLLKFSFTSPEMLTRWKLQLLAHNKNAESGLLTKEVVTQKDLNIVLNTPRFFREGDEITLSAKLVNLTKENLNASCKLEFYDSNTSKKLEMFMIDSSSYQKIDLMANSSSSLSWKVKIPSNIPAITYKIVAVAGNFQDGEEDVIPVLSNQILLSNTELIWVAPDSEKELNLSNLTQENLDQSESLNLALEVKTNTNSIILESLPYLMDYAHLCSEQTFSKLYANAMGAHLIKSNPDLATFIQEYDGSTTTEKDAKEILKRNMVLKSPWFKKLLTPQEKIEQLKKYLDPKILEENQTKFINRLKMMQLSNGMFPWFDNGRAAPSITQHIVKGLGVLKESKALSDDKFPAMMYKNAIKGLDQYWANELKNHLKRNDSSLANFKFNTSYWDYLNSRIYCDDCDMKKEYKDVYDAGRNIAFAKARTNFASQTIYKQLLIANVFFKNGKVADAETIMEGLKQIAVKNDDEGMYWKINSNYGWYGNRIETQALAIQSFRDITSDDAVVEGLKIWLLNNKSSTGWGTTKSTVAACNVLVENKSVSGKLSKIKMLWGGEKVRKDGSIKQSENKLLGIATHTLPVSQIEPTYSKASIRNRSDEPIMGSISWDYHTDLNNVKALNKDFISVDKKLFIENYSGNEMSWVPLNDGSLKVGDKVKIRMLVKTSKNISYVHIKDLRASGFEPIEFSSGHHSTNGAVFYKSIRDASHHYYFEYMKAGSYVLEYEVVCNNPGNFTNGFTVLETMYNPDFKSYSSSSNVVIKP
ncbi:MAG: alpha-2-macroglobulin family protein [Nonlabens sp.]